MSQVISSGFTEREEGSTVEESRVPSEKEEGSKVGLNREPSCLQNLLKGENI